MDNEINTVPEAIEAAPAVETMADVAAPPRKARRKVQDDVVAAVKKVNARRVKTERKPRAGKRAQSAVNEAAASAPINETAATQPQKESVMNFDATNWMNNFSNFNALPGADKFQSLFAQAGERGQQAIERSRTVAEEMSELARANVEALVETGRIAAAGAQSLGQEAAERAREGFEQAAAQAKTLAEANGPAEFFQLQGEIVRTQFDRFVAENSRMTESLVKLTGEALQPLSNRAAINAEKLNSFTA
ncbi:phasin family protein [Sphingomonas sp. GCM10030256]|uniref:phasin family protein n=1 Tax=Sphingomonas sp. GCM10030256 TaxID=3273427 RepID=UPI00361988E8